MPPATGTHRSDFGLYLVQSTVGIPVLQVGEDVKIINAYTQFRTSSFVCDVFEYEGFAKILNTLASEYPSGNFGLPYIGMGLANGNPSRIIPMIEKFANQVTSTGGSVTLVEYKP